MSAVAEQYDSISILSVPQQQVIDYWPMVRGHVEDALELDGCWTTHATLLKILSGEWQLMLICRGPELLASMVISVEAYPAKRVLEVFSIGGKRFQDWIGDVQECLTGIARHYECESIRACCRPGMAKWLEQIGYGRRQTIMEIAIDGR